MNHENGAGCRHRLHSWKDSRASRCGRRGPGTDPEAAARGRLGGRRWLHRAGGAARAHGPSSGQGALREHSPGEGRGPPRGGGRGGWTRGPLPALACGSSQAPEPRGFRPPLPVPVFLQVCGGFLRNSLWFKGKSRGRKSWAGGEETKPALGGQPTAASAWPAPRPAPGPPSP